MEKCLIAAVNREKFQVVENLDECKPMNNDMMICERPRIWNGASSHYCIWKLFNQNSETYCQAIREPARTVLIDLADDN